MNLRHAIAAPILLLLGGFALAQTAAPEPPDAPEPPPLPPKKTAGDDLSDAGVVIRTGEEGQVIEEYSQNGRIYMVKITPKNLPPYYLYDLDGDGLFEDMDPKSPIKPVQWKVKQW